MFKVWLKILNGFYCKFIRHFSAKRIRKMGLRFEEVTIIDLGCPVL